MITIPELLLTLGVVVGVMRILWDIAKRRTK